MSNPSRLRPPATATETALTEERLAELRAVLPEAFADGRINWETLRETLDPLLEDEGAGAEHFGLFWPGKREARRLAALPSRGALHPAPGEGVNEETTRNIFIKGDNLEVLKLLLKSYAGQVKMIYIDPPYNTGNDFVYEDDYSEPLESYLRRTGQISEQGIVQTSSTKASGRFHSRWLSMMYPRLVLARALLHEDGVIFASIDDNEVHNLRTLMSEIFGEENFLGQVCVLVNPKGRVLGQHFARSHEYILAYSKASLSHELGIPKTASQIEAEYPESDEEGQYRLLELRNTHRQFGRHNRRNLWFPLYVDPTSGRIYVTPQAGCEEVYPIWPDGYEGCWTWESKKVTKDLRLLVGRFVNGQWKVFRKAYSTNADGSIVSKKLKTIWTDPSMYTERGQKELDELIPGSVFQSPKPVALIRLLAEMCTSGDDLVVDFFAGSGTTGQAIFDLNQLDSGIRRFILVQAPEPTPEQSTARQAGYHTIADIGKERIRRVIAKMRAEKATRLMEAHDGAQDLGFRVYKLGRSDVRPWRDYEGEDVQTLEGLFAATERPLVDGWTPQGVLTEIMLLQGFPLDSALDRVQWLRANAVTRITSDVCAHALYVCLDDQVADETVAAVCDGDPRLDAHDIFVCLDSALTDEDKMRLADVCGLQTI